MAVKCTPGRADLGTVKVAVGEVFEADSPRGPRRVEVRALDEEKPPIAEVVEVCTHAIRTAGLCGCVPSPRFRVVLGWRDGGWRMPPGYRPAA